MSTPWLFQLMDDVQHIKSGAKYVIYGKGYWEPTQEEVYVYGKSSDGLCNVQVRTKAQMEDGRFVKLD